MNEDEIMERLKVAAELAGLDLEAEPEIKVTDLLCPNTRRKIGYEFSHVSSGVVLGNVMFGGNA